MVTGSVLRKDDRIFDMMANHVLTGTLTQANPLVLKFYYNTPWYTVDFVMNGGLSIPSQEKGYGQKATQPVEPSYAGYEFVARYVDSQLTQQYNFDTPITKDITLYAKRVSANFISTASYTATDMVKRNNCQA